jgi:ADP-heptose:LPS heptosyltransferase
MRIVLSKFAGIGDTILTTPAVRALRQKFPEAEIIYMTNPYGAKALKGNPHLSEVVVLDKDPWRTRIGPFSLPIRRYHVVYREIYGRLNAKPGVDLLVDWNKSYSGYCINKHIKAGKSIAFELAGRRAYVNRRYTHVIYEKGLEYQAKRFLRTVIPLGVDASDLRTEYHGIDSESDEASDVILRRLGLASGYVLVNVSASQVYKQWPVEFFIRLIKEMEKSMSMRILLFHGNAKEELATGSRVKEACVYHPYWIRLFLSQSWQL